MADKDVTELASITGALTSASDEFVVWDADEVAAEKLKKITRTELIAALKVVATTSVQGVVELATDGEAAANVAVQGNDSRLADERTPVDGSASNTKLANMLADTIKGRANGAGTGAPQDLTASQVRTIINVEDGASADQTGAEIKSAYEGEADTNAFTDAEQTKVSHLTVTQAVDLDAIETRVNALDAAVVLQGTVDASMGAFPGGGTAQAGDSWIVSVGGTIDSVTLDINDRVVAITDNASTSIFAGNWHKLDYTDAVLSVAGKTGAVTLVLADITDAGTLAAKSSVNDADWSGTDLAVANGGTGASTASAARTNLGVALGSDVQGYDATLTALAGVVTGADKLPYFTGADVAAVTDFTPAARTVLDDATVAAMVDTLGGAASTGTGGIARAISPALTTPDIGTPTAGTLTSCTGLPQAGTVGLTTADSPQFTGVNVGHASDSTITRSGPGALQVEGAQMLLNNTGIFDYIFIGAGAMIPRTTNGASVGTVELATNDVMLDTLDFDTATDEGAGFWLTFPIGWTAGTVQAKVFWTAASGSGTVAWSIAAQGYADNAALDQALGAAQTPGADTLHVANDMHITAKLGTALTIADAADGEPVYFEIIRDVSEDTLAVDAQLIGVQVEFQRNFKTAGW